MDEVDFGNKVIRSNENKNPDEIVSIGIVVLSGLEPPTHGFSVRCSTT